MKSIKTLLTLAVLLLQMAAEAQKNSTNHFNNLDKDGVILQGYDPVAFFTQNKPVKGDPALKYTHEEATYLFSTTENLELFKADPDKYKVQFGGWCAYAVSLGRIAPIDVNTFSIVDGRLVVQHNQRAVDGWKKDVEGNLVKADKYWPEVAKHNGKQIKTDEERAYLNNTDKEGVILQGYDPVAYFTVNAAVKGDPQFSARFNGATYWFSTAENAEKFKDSPSTYAPQYGSFCGYAMSLGKLRPVDPTIFQLYEGRLILQHTQDAYEQFNKDLTNNVVKADQNWPTQVKKHAGRRVKFDKPAKPAASPIASKK
jgi:YHS domain-containing protein